MDSIVSLRRARPVRRRVRTLLRSASVVPYSVLTQSVAACNSVLTQPQTGPAARWDTMDSIVSLRKKLGHRRTGRPARNDTRGRGVRGFRASPDRSPGA